MGMMQAFKEFALKGNVMDLAVGVIIGGAFGKIVDSIVGDLIMPIVSKIFGGLDFSSYYVALAGHPAGLPLAEAKKAGAVLAYGNFITIALNFVILAFIIFMMVKQMNRLKRDEPVQGPAVKQVPSELVSQQAADRALARSAGPIDGCHRDCAGGRLSHRHPPR